MTYIQIWTLAPTFLVINIITAVVTIMILFHTSHTPEFIQYARRQVNTLPPSITSSAVLQRYVTNIPQGATNVDVRPC
jgi:hypothetical protein